MTHVAAASLSNRSQQHDAHVYAYYELQMRDVTDDDNGIERNNNFQDASVIIFK